MDKPVPRKGAKYAKVAEQRKDLLPTMKMTPLLGGGGGRGWWV
jgi:hypothetical protein